MPKRLKWFLLLIVGIIFVSLLINTLIKPETPVLRQKAKVIRVIDGDTIELEGGAKLRYIGIDTPETQTSQCFNQEASDKNRQLVEGKEIELEKDVSDTDKYGRLLRYVWIGDELINQQLVVQGYAKLDTVPPDIKYSQLFMEAQKTAKNNNAGLWNKCP